MKHTYFIFSLLVLFFLTNLASEARFVENNPTSKLDIYGLAMASPEVVEDGCTIKIIMGHGTLSGPNGGPRQDGVDPFVNPFPDTIHNHFLNDFPARMGGVCYLGCNANSINNRVPNGQRVPIPDLPDHGDGNDAGRGVWDPDDEGAYDAIMAAAEAAETHAETFCDEPKCCATWKIEIELLPGTAIDPADDPDLQGLGPNHRSVLARNRLLNLHGKTKKGFCPR
jgi:hypothetical protein